MSGRSLAVKVLHPHLIGDSKATSRFIQERHVLSRVSHANVVEVIELVAEGDQLSIVMELVEGGDLKQLHQRARPLPSEAVTMVARIADALAALHAAGVVHRDLKPANVLIHQTEDGPVPKITDFGLSRLVEEGMSQSSAAVGTPLYMAPEAVALAATAGPPADVYALGIMLYELLVGQPPFVGGGTMAILRAHTEEVPPRIEGVPADLQSIVRQTLAKDAAARPTAAELRDRLREAVGAVDDTVPPRAVPDVDLHDSETIARIGPLAAVDDADMTVAVAPLAPSRLVVLPERRIGPWPAERVMIAAATTVAALVLVGVLVAVKVTGGSDVKPDAFSFAFDPALVGEVGIASRHWSLSSDGKVLTGDLLVSNGGKEPLTLDHVEVLPESVAADIGDVRFDPRPAELLADDRAAVLTVDTLDPGARVTFTYTADLAGGEASLERLTALAQDQMAAEKAFYDKQENADREEPESLDIASLTVTPDAVTLDVGGEQELVVTGTLADGSPAPPEALTAAAWSSGDPSIAAMVGNRVIALAPGGTTLTAQVGEANGFVTLLVNQPLPEVVAGPVIRSSGGGRATGDGSAAGATGDGASTGGATGGAPGGGATEAATGDAPVVGPVDKPVDKPVVTAPSAPGPISVNQNGLNGVSLAWSSPANDGGAAVDLYEVRPQGGAARSTSGTSMSFEGLAYATTYRFEARAHNSAGWGPWGGTSAGYLTAERPGVPTLSTPVASNITETTATISFTSSLCTTADYHLSGGPGHTSPGWPRAWQLGTSCWFDHGWKFTGLTPGTTYTVTIDVKDTGGGSYSTRTMSFRTPGGPQPPPSFFEIIGVTDTTVTVAAGGDPCATMTISSSAGQTVTTPCTSSYTYTFTGLKPGTRYLFTMTGQTADKVVGGGPLDATTRMAPPPDTTSSPPAPAG